VENDRKQLNTVEDGCFLHHGISGENEILALQIPPFRLKAKAGLAGQNAEPGVAGAIFGGYSGMWARKKKS